ncbi:hypothetical protein B0T16DRAFT_412380 [Cercophora newfieldiana]|uniref:USP domain-containing protein n=1 Tax=Cercophora newfieldiana TaxID=92897 RepID=A0AA39Y4Q3_9PEZI|nr:hypothetical protein B0T16DRAFT_412380 [Cercophora newfieldiana]
MAQAPNADDSRERAVSSEPCSTRPNPFDDSDVLSRKRRRTSRSGASRSRSVDTVNSSQGSHTAGDSGPESDSAMKIDSISAAPATPEPQQPPRAPASSGPRSSRVTINVRTPSRPLEAIPSSPSSPVQRASAFAPADPADAVHISVEEADLDMSRDDTIADTPASSASGSSSPPVELISVEADHDDFDAGDKEVMIMGESICRDPSANLPFHEPTETYLETVTRLSQFFTQYGTIADNFSQWIEKYLSYVAHMDYLSVLQSYHEHREVWNSVPQAVSFMNSRKDNSPRSAGVRESISNFYKSFARLTSFFVELDLKMFRNMASPDQHRLPELASPPYVKALGLIARGGEMGMLSHPLGNGDGNWHYVHKLDEILDAIHGFHANQGGALAYVKRLVAIEADLVPRTPRLTEHIAYLCVLTADIMALSQRRLSALSHHVADQARNNIASGYGFFNATSVALTQLIDKHVNIPFDAASVLLQALTDIYQICLSTDRIVPLDILKEHRQNHPSISPRNTAEAIAYRWKFTKCSKLIMSSQMQLRVMAVSAMCNDLVTFYKKYNEPSEDSSIAFMSYVADFLLKAGLVAYILGPTCHPEITIESSNIIGFLVVSATYTNSHTDALWQTVTSTQDPRVSDALIRMTSRIANLFMYEALLYFCEKLNTVPVENFGATMREFCENVLRHLIIKMPVEKTASDSAPYDLCIRLIRQSSVFGVQSPTAHPDLNQFAIQKFKELLSHGPTIDCRGKIYQDCMNDIASKSASSIGSLWVLCSMLRPTPQRELHALTAEHDFTRLLVDELEAAIPAAQRAGFPTVLSGPQNFPRREMLALVIHNEPATIDGDLGPRLWHLLVGPGAASQEDRDVAWCMLYNSCRGDVSENPFVLTCYSQYLPTLDPEYFCAGALKFVCKGIVPKVNDALSILLDDEDSADRAGIEQLWRMILTAPDGTIEHEAIRTLARDIYIDSVSIRSFSHYRARKVHLALVDRCLRQLSSAAAKLKAFNNAATVGDDDSMVVVTTDQQLLEQELLFIRSLSVLREFHCLYQEKAHFSAPDLRSLILDSPNEVEGDPAELKYQSFDGDTQTDIKPLKIGKRNTAASLLASLREVTGFNNYRIYYKGRPFVPQESDICRSLEDLRIHNGIILVKRESDVPASPTRPRAGASPVEVEILSHFEEFWEYLSMEDKLAQEIFNFLVKLPADERTLKVIEDPTASYLDIFSRGQPFKSLYAVHAVREYLASQQRKTPSAQLDNYLDSAGTAPCPYSVSVGRAMTLIVSAISDHEVVDQCANQVWRVELSSSLVECLVILLKDSFLPISAAESLNPPLLDRLLSILMAALSTPTPDSATKHIPFCLQSILEACSLSQTFMSAFRDHDSVPRVLKTLLLDDQRLEVRSNAALSILEKLSGNLMRPDTVTHQFRSFFWPLISDLVKPAVANPGNSTGVLELCLETFKILRDARSQILDVQKNLEDWSDLLLGYTTFEDVTQPDMIDHVASFLTRLLHSVLCAKGSPLRQEINPERGIARRIFWKHLFPQFGRPAKFDSRPILQSQTRGMLIDVIFSLIEGDSTQLMWLVHDLNDLLPLFPEEDDMYAYELCFGFERSKAVRAPCGYVGLKNLSNTCYLNSLFTQLFMNTDFRQFILKAEVRDRDINQALLFHTQKLFGFMQGSIRRFVTPDDCVANIKTYEDTQIDIHNQMDVDEFYNLLFDRWEVQFLTSEEKRQFRSFYGGQLVQQVASKECEHISERLEPFSAIQCDIKGKSSLQESLQAYVDGEPMQGDNKYKCSKCDRHVDAVKRACLKDIPDNLIFHLKRFDFNLRTLQRSKINDYFSFPTKIDMRPYTIDHISDSSESESTTEDIFELVGVLVHSGTAESGHYYSYVRERPSSSENPVWVEFNDDVVSPWDPALMENSCFGGADYRSHFDNSNGVYEKTYSAYMLFYQRSTSVARNQELLRKLHCSSPLRVEVLPELGEFIEDENTTLLRRHCLYDPSQITFVNLTLLHVKSIGGNGCSADHALETVALSMALSHLDQVASRTKDVPDFFNLLRRISAMCQSCVRCCLAVFHYFYRHQDALRFMVQKNPDAEIRQATVSLFIQILEAMKEQMPEQYGLPSADPDEESDDEEFASRNSVMARTIEIFKIFWDNFHSNLRSWPEVFGFMLSFVKMGRHELMEFLQENYLKFLLTILWADPSFDLSPQFMRMTTAVSRRMATRPPSYEAVISLVHALTASMSLLYTDHGSTTGPEHPDQRFGRRAIDGEPRIWFTKAEARILDTDWDRGMGNVFLDKLITINQNPAATHSIIRNLMKQSRVMEEKVLRTLRMAIHGGTTQHQIGPFLRVASQVFCRFSAYPDLVENLISYVGQQCNNVQGSEGKAFLDFHKEVFSELHENPNFPADRVLDVQYDSILEWAPGLLGYYEIAVATETEEFLHEVLFRHAPSIAHHGVAEGDGIQAKIAATARALALRCLAYLRDTYVSRRMDVSTRLVMCLERSIKECSKFYNLKEPSEDEEATEFLRLSNTVMDPLRKLLVEELEEDGSEWEGSSGSEQLTFEDVSVPIAGELQVGGLE